MNHSFDFEIVHNGHTLNVTGSISPAVPQRGPSFDCGGTPAESAEIEDLEIFMLRKRHKSAQGWARRLLADPNGKLFSDIEDAILERASEDEADSFDDEAEARADARREGED